MAGRRRSLEEWQRHPRTVGALLWVWLTGCAVAGSVLIQLGSKLARYLRAHHEGAPA